MIELAIGDCDDLWTYLNQEADLISRIHKDRSGYYYASISDFVRQEGEPFYKIAEMPEEWRGEQKECYRNSYLLALEREELTYVEGYATGVIAVPHAWCVNEENEVIDPTWANPGSAYFGVRFSSDEMVCAVAASGHYGLLDDWQHDFPYMQKKREE